MCLAGSLGKAVRGKKRELGGSSTHGTYLLCFLESSFRTVLTHGLCSEHTSSVLFRKLEGSMFCTSS